MGSQERRLMSYKDTGSSSSSGIGFTGLLTVVFVALRLIPYKNGHVINWSWWWVLSPIWITTLLAFLIILGVLVFIVAKEYHDTK